MAAAISTGDAILALPRPFARVMLVALKAAVWAVVGRDEDRESLEQATRRDPQDSAATRFSRDVESALVERVRRGDHDAFREIVGHYEARLRLLAFHLLRDAQLMNDAVQDTFLKAYVALPDYRGEAALGSWLHRICYRVCLDHLRRAKSRPTEAEISSELADPLDAATQLALQDEVALALAALPVEQRAVLLLVDHAGYDYALVAEALEVPIGTVASRLSTARRAVRRALRPQANGEGGAR